MSDSAPEPTREPDARHQTAVPSPKRLAFAGITSLGVSLLTLAYVISEYGSRLKNISDGLIENVCSVNQETLWDEFLYRLIGCPPSTKVSRFKVTEFLYTNHTLMIPVR